MANPGLAGGMDPGCGAETRGAPPKDRSERGWGGVGVLGAGNGFSLDGGGEELKARIQFSLGREGLNPPGPPRLWPLCPPDLSPLQPQAQPQSHPCALPRPHGLPAPLTAPEGRALMGGHPEGQVNVGGPSGLGVVPGNSTHPLTFFRRGN